MRLRRTTLLPMSDHQVEDVNINNQVDITSISLSSKQKDTIHQIPTYFAFLIIILLCLLYGGVYLLDASLPTPYKISHEKEYPDAFIAERAQNILRGLTDLGPKVVGSRENEKLAVRYINDEIDKIINGSHPSFRITVDNQRTSGVYYLGFLPNGLINSYGNVQNIIVKLESTASGKKSSTSEADDILINAHFDSVPTSPGASDDGIMIAVMLETLRKLTQTEQHFERNVIFLFNGAEESPLQAAHGFITQHKWAKTCRTIINLEAAGHGGKAILFQSGPNGSSALMGHYLSVPYPYAQAAGEEIFQSNLIPSDTDFRLFRDFGGLSGFDMAFSQNGYRYHTKYDRFDDLPLGSYQHIGGNLLALVKSLATDPNVMVHDDSKVVYFDVFTWFIICYSTLAAYIVNIVVAVGSLVVAIFSAPKLQIGFSLQSLLYLSLTTAVILGSWLCGGAIALLIAYLVDVTGNSMTWYASPIIIFALYAAPILATFTGVMFIFNRFANHKGKSLSAQSQIQMHIMRLIWTFVLFAGTCLNLRSVYVILIPVLFNTLAGVMILVFKWQHSVRKWQICSFVFTLLPTIMAMYLGNAIFSLFIPITGRIGANRNPELIISLLTLLVLLLVTTHYMPYSALVRRQYWVPSILFLGFVITFIIVLTGSAFPYSGDNTSPAPQRFTLFHTNRIHHQADINVPPEEESGIFILNMDRNSPDSVKHYIDLDNDYNITADCERYPACGMPISSSRMLALVEASTWIPFDRAIILEPILMRHTITPLSNHSKRYNFTVEGPDHLTIFIRPRKGATILTTSLHDIKTDDLIFINHVYGIEKTPLTFSVDVQMQKADANNIALLDFVVSGKYYNFNGRERIGEKFKEFVFKFPDWADVTAALANYESYII